MNLEAQIEGVLFYRSEPVAKQELCDFFEISTDLLQNALNSLREKSENGGIVLIETDTEVQLTTAPALAECIEKLRREELKKDIGKAGAETLAIVLYRGPISRSDIDRIRGVNSNFILRNLLVRGLIERRDNPENTRTFLYAITPTLLTHLGVSRKEDLPEYKEIMDALDTYEEEARREEQSEAT